MHQCQGMATVFSLENIETDTCEDPAQRTATGAGVVDDEGKGPMTAEGRAHPRAARGDTVPIVGDGVFARRLR